MLVSGRRTVDNDPGPIFEAQETLEHNGFDQ